MQNDNAIDVFITDNRFTVVKKTDFNRRITDSKYISDTASQQDSKIMQMSNALSSV